MRYYTGRRSPAIPQQEISLDSVLLDLITYSQSCGMLDPDADGEDYLQHLYAIEAEVQKKL